jgi:hypothetical protein
VRGKRIEEMLGRIEQRLQKLEAEGCVWRDVARQLADEKRELLDRLMSKSFEEYRTYSFVPEERPAKPYDLTSDPGIAGTAVAVEQ